MTTNNNENKNTTITVLDTAQAFRELLTAPVADRPDLVRRMWEPMAGMFRFFPGGAQAVDIAEMDRHSVSFDWSGDTTASYVDRIDHAIDLMADVFAAELYGEVGYTHFIDPVALEDGDASARLFGVDPVGVPTGAGYAVGARIVRNYLATTGTTAAQNVRTPADRIIAVAMRDDGGR